MSLQSGRFAWHSWQEGEVVYDRHLGDTHAMSSATACAFRALLNTPGAKDEWLAGVVRQVAPKITGDELDLALRSARGLLRESVAA